MKQFISIIYVDNFDSLILKLVLLIFYHYSLDMSYKYLKSTCKLLLEKNRLIIYPLQTCKICSTINSSTKVNLLVSIKFWSVLWLLWFMDNLIKSSYLVDTIIFLAEYINSFLKIFHPLRFLNSKIRLLNLKNKITSIFFWHNKLNFH